VYGDKRPCPSVETPGREEEPPEVGLTSVSDDRSANRPARQQDAEPSELTCQSPVVSALGEQLRVKDRAEECVLEEEQRYWRPGRKGHSEAAVRAAVRCFDL
jgi:hypothetical protein